MGKRIAEIVVLVEDQAQLSFVRRYVKQYIEYAGIRVDKAPPGQGAGEQWVKQEYPSEVDHYRRQSARRKSALVVVLDADTSATASESRRPASPD